MTDNPKPAKKMFAIGAEPPTSCLDCYNHRTIPDPDPYDWFCDDDVAVVCVVTPNPRQHSGSRYLSQRQQYRTITVACRPYNKRQETQRPDWCPVYKTDRKAKKKESP